MSTVEEIDPIERDVDLAWELYDAQPTHPEIGRLATRVLAQQPGRNGIRMLLAMHRNASGAVDEARDILLSVAGQRDRFFVNAARELRDLEQSECRYDEARRWAETAVREDPERWLDQMELGLATAMCGELDAGWRLLDAAVATCASTDADTLPDALVSRAIHLMQSWAPHERFVPAAEEAMRANPSSEFIGGPLAWAYMATGRFDDAEELALRLLRLDPTDGIAEGVVTVIRSWRATIAKGEVTFADIHDSGLVEIMWTQKRDELLGTDLASALAALEPVLPAELRSALRPPGDEDTVRDTAGEREIAAWHDGQEPGTAGLWGVDGDFRLMSGAEIAAMDEAIEKDPEAWPGWEQDRLDDYYTQVMTDDEGSYLIATLENVVIRRSGSDDVVVTSSLSAWFWDRVAAFGGRDPRPLARRDQEDSPGPRPEVLAELDRLNDACRAAPGDVEPQIQLWQAVTALDHWVCINRGSPEEPRPYSVAAADGVMLCIFSDAQRATATAHASGLVPDADPVPLFAVPLPAALDWAMSFGERGVVGVTIDHPQLGAWCPLPNLARLRQMRERS